MRLTMEQRMAVTAKTAARYRQASKKMKGLSLAEFVRLTEYARQYARKRGKRKRRVFMTTKW